MREVKIAYFLEKGPLLSQSPPNSGFKESTRMESPANSSMKSDMSGASPSFFRGEDVKRGSKKKSDKSNHNSSSNDPKYTKLRLTPLQKKNKAGKIDLFQHQKSPSFQCWSQAVG